MHEYSQKYVLHQTQKHKNVYEEARGVLELDLVLGFSLAWGTLCAESICVYLLHNKYFLFSISVISVLMSSY